MFQIKDNSARAKQIISIFWVVIALSVLNMGSLYWQYLLLTDAQINPDGADMSKIETSDLLQLSIGIATIVIAILNIVFFIMWFRRAYNNLHALQNNYATMGEGWAAGAWFVPFLNLVRPYQIMNEIWQGTQKALTHKLGEPRSNSLIGFWWALYLIMNIYGIIVARFTMNDENIDMLLAASKLDFIYELISVPAAIITVIMIQKTQVFENALLEESQQPAESIFSTFNNPQSEN